MQKLLSILENWREQTEKLRLAVNNRNYTLFTVAFRDGSKCFEQLRTVLESDQADECRSRFRQEILATVTDWVALTDGLKVWMEEIRLQAEQAQKGRHANTVDRKLASAYGYMKKSGNKLRLSR